MRKIFSIFIFLFIFSFLAFSFAPNSLAAKDYGLNETAKEAGLDTVAVASSPEAIIGVVIGAMLAFIGVIFLVLMIYGGFIWMLARGNEAEVEKAKKIINTAIIGVIIVIASYAFTQFVLSVLLK